MNQRGFAPLILLVLTIPLMLGVGTYLYLKSNEINMQNVDKQSNGANFPTALSSLATANDKFYINNKYGYGLNYPASAQIEELEDVQCFDSYVTIKVSEGIELQIQEYAGTGITVDQVISMHQNGDHGCIIEADPNAKNVTTVIINEIPVKTFVSKSSQTYILQINNKTLEIIEKYKTDSNKKTLDSMIDTFKLIPVGENLKILNDVRNDPLEEETDKLLREKPTASFSVIKVENNFAIGKAPTHTWIAINTRSIWKVVWQGQESPRCEDVDKYNIPKSIYGDCYLEAGKLRSET